MLSEEEIDDHVAEVTSRGFTIVNKCIDTSLLQRLVSAKCKLVPNGIGIVNNLISKDPAFWDLASNLNILRVVKRILADDCLLSSTSLSCSVPGKDYFVEALGLVVLSNILGDGAQEYHTDDLLYGRELFPRPLRHQLSVNTITALTGEGYNAPPHTTPLNIPCFLLQSLHMRTVPLGLSRTLINGTFSLREGIHLLLNQR